MALIAGPTGNTPIISPGGFRQSRVAPVGSGTTPGSTGAVNTPVVPNPTAPTNANNPATGNTAPTININAHPGGTVNLGHTNPDGTVVPPGHPGNSVNLGHTGPNGVVIPPHPGLGGGHGGVGPTGMPLDSAASIALQQAAAARQTFLDQLGLQHQQIVQNYGDQLEDMNKQQPIDQATLNSGYGSRGLGFSSGYGIANGRLADAYFTNQSRLSQAEQDALNQLRTERLDYRHEYNTNLSAIRQAAADRLSALAGTLGLGRPTQNAGALANQLNGNKGGKGGKHGRGKGGK